MKQQQRFAVLIDADNARSGVIGMLLEEVAKYGVASVKRAYGDWTTPRLASWKEALNEHAIQPIQQFTYTSGKNNTDSALIIDAMDLLYRDHLDGYCIVSSDSDFTRLATRLRESRMTVIGFGEEKTPRAFVSACDKFVYTEILSVESQDGHSYDGPPARKSTKELRADTKLVRLLRTATTSTADDEGWALLSRVGQYLPKHSPDVDARNYGYRSLLPLVEATELFEVTERKTSNGHLQKFIRDNRQRKSPT